MNILIHLLFVKSVFGQVWISKSDFPPLYNREVDLTDGIKLNERFPPTSKNGIDMLSLYNGQNEPNNTDLIDTVNNLIELGKNALDTDDDTEYIDRPCRFYDKNCIRRYFAAHSMCTPKYQPVPEPFFVPQTTFYLPRINVTVTPNNVYYRGANARIRDFYANRKTNRLVLVFTFSNLTVTADPNYFRFNRRGKEPTVIGASVTVRYLPLTVTVIIPNLKDLKLEKSEVSIFIESNSPSPILIEPSLFASTDVNVQLSLVDFLLRRDVNLEEAFITDGNSYANAYIQQSICDFGLITS